MEKILNFFKLRSQTAFWLLKHMMRPARSLPFDMPGLYEYAIEIPQISGWFNDTIGGYTCTQNCGPPTNYSWLVKSNYTGNQTVIPYNTMFR